MNYAKIDKNDITNGEGVCVSLWVSGCPLHCSGCHNSEIWDFESGQLFTEDTMNEILSALSTNGIQRNFSVLGGEPLAPRNTCDVANIIHRIREAYPDIKIYVWTGYEMWQLARRYEFSPILARSSSLACSRSLEESIALATIFGTADYIIDGPYIEAERDITLKLRGSRNQHIWERQEDGGFHIIE